MEKIRVLVTLGSLGVGGNEMFAMNLFRYLDKDKFSMDFVSFDNNRLDYYDEIVSKGSKVYFCESRSKKKITRMLEEERKVEDVLKKETYDIIHCNSCSFFGLFPGVLAGRKAGIKVISHSHGVGMNHKTILDTIVYGLMKKVLCRNIDYAFSCSDFAGESKYTSKVLNSNSYFIIRNAIESDKFVFDPNVRLQTRRELGIADEEFVLGHVGRFEEEKNHTFIIDVFKALQSTEPKSKLLLVGTGSLMGEVESKISELQLNERVILLGQSNRVNTLYQAMDCFILPSLHEGFPFVLVEAQINGLNSIVSDVITRTVDFTGGVCFFSLQDTSEHWAKKALELGRKRMSAETTEKAKNLYGLKQETRRIEGLYNQLIHS